MLLQTKYCGLTESRLKKIQKCLALLKIAVVERMLQSSKSAEKNGAKFLDYRLNLQIPIPVFVDTLCTQLLSNQQIYTVSQPHNKLGKFNHNLNNKNGKFNETRPNTNSQKCSANSFRYFKIPDSISETNN